MHRKRPTVRSTGRVNRRTFIGGAGALAAGTAIAAACGGKGGGSPSSATEVPGTPQPGGTLKVGFPFDPDNLDPAQGGFAFVVFQHIYSYLHHINGNTLEYIPDVASSFEQPDETTYLFHLRNDVRFQNIPPSNGRLVTAKDVVYSMNRLNEVLNPIDPGLMSRVVDKVEVVNETTVKVTTKKPYASTMQVLGGFWYAIVPEEAVTAFGGLSKKALGSGPFQLERFEQEAGASLVRSANYHKPGRPYLDGINIAVIADSTNSLSQFRTKALDINVAPLDEPRFQALSKELSGVRGSKAPAILDPWVGLNLRRPPWNDPRARQAFDLAIDRKQMIAKLVFGQGKLNGPIPWGNERWALPQDELERTYAVDKAEAKRLFTAAGVGDLKIMHRVTPALPFGKEIGEFLKEQLREYGIDVTIDVREQNDWIQTVLLKRDFDTCGFAWFPVLDPTVSLRFIDKDDIFSGTTFGFEDAEIASLYDKMQATFDVDARKQATFDLQRAVLKFHGPVLHLFDGYQYNLWWPWVHNWKPENTELNLYSDEQWLSART